MAPDSDCDTDTDSSSDMLLGGALSRLSVEPMMFLYYTAASVAQLASTNLLLQKACSPQRPLPDDRPCDEAQVQELLTSINVWRPLFEYSFPVVFILLAGAWSDAHGRRRKPLMILPITGEIVSLFFLIANVYFWQWTPRFTVLVDSVIRGLTGGRTCFSFGAITYIADNTTTDQRTFRLAIITGLIFMATPVGNFLGGILRASYGFYTVFNLCMCLNLVALLCGLTLLKRPSDDPPSEHSCGLSHLLATCSTVFRPRAGPGRAVLLLMIVVSPLFGACLIGEYSVLYFYLRFKFRWGEVQYGSYSAFRMTATFVGTLLSVGLLSRVCRLPDAVVGLLASTAQVFTAVLNSRASDPWQLFVYPLLDLMHGAIYTVGHSIVSKTVDSAELGKVNSVLGSVDCLVPLVVIPLYNKTYNLTFHRSPGDFFLISAGLGALTWTIFLAVSLMYRHERRRPHLTVT